MKKSITTSILIVSLLSLNSCKVKGYRGEIIEPDNPEQTPVADQTKQTLPATEEETKTPESPQVTNEEPTTLSIQVFLNGEAQANIDVFSHKKDGSFIHQGKTDDQGMAELNAETDASVSAIFTNSQTSVTTVFGVNPGDQVVIQGKSSFLSPESEEFSNLTINDAHPEISYDRTVYHPGISGTTIAKNEESSSVSVSVKTDAVSENQADLLALTFSNASTDPSAYALKTSIDLNPGQDTPLTLTGADWKTDFESLSFGVGNLSEVQKGSLSFKMEFYRNNKLYFDTSSSQTGLSQASENFTAKLAPNFFDKSTYQLIAKSEIDSNTEQVSYTLRKTITDISKPVSIFEPILLGKIHDLQVNYPPATPSRPQFSWSAVGGFTSQMDISSITVTYNDDKGWTAFAPPNITTSLSFPQFPDNFQSASIQLNEENFKSLRVTYGESTKFSNYGDFLKQGIEIDLNADTQTISAVKPATGEL